MCHIHIAYLMYIYVLDVLSLSRKIHASANSEIYVSHMYNKDES